LALIKIYLRNEDNSDLYVSLYDDLGKKLLLDEEFFGEDGTKDVDVEESGGSGLVSWSCYRREDPQVTASEEEVEVSSGQTLEIST
jgi:hypothetical protein